MIAGICARLFNDTVLPSSERTWKGTLVRVLMYAISFFVVWRIILANRRSLVDMGTRYV